MPETETRLPLNGLTVVVTRPRLQSVATAMALRDAGASVIELPMLEISPRTCAIEPHVIEHAYAAIFVSANAVEHGVPCLRACGTLSEKALVMAIGLATARALDDAGFADVVSPQQSIDSEGLLAMPQLQQPRVKGQHVILLRGRSESGGRKLLEEVLVERGAKVVAAECYERRTLEPSSEKLARLINSAKNPVGLMALSVETLDSLMRAFAGHEAAMRSAWLLVPHARVAAAARERQFTRILEVGVSAESLISALMGLQVRCNDPVK